MITQIAAVYCICGALAREAAEAAEGEPAIELVAAPAAAIADLLHEDTGSWIAAHGGWVLKFSHANLISGCRVTKPKDI